MNYKSMSSDDLRQILASAVDLVPQLVSPVVIRHAVSMEINAGGDDAATRFLAQNSWLSVVQLAPALPPLATWRLGRGESEVLEYARRNPGTIAVVDDTAARRAAHVLDIPLTGTLRLVVAAVGGKLLPSLSDAINTLRLSGLYMDPATVSRLLEEHA